MTPPPVGREEGRRHDDGDARRRGPAARDELVHVVPARRVRASPERGAGVLLRARLDLGDHEVRRRAHHLEDARSCSRTATTSSSPRRGPRTTASATTDARCPGAPSSAGSRRWGPTDSDSVVMADGERHDFLRKIASYAFTPKAVAQLEQQVQELAVELFDEIEPETEVDFVNTIAAPLPDDHDRPDARCPKGGPSSSSECGPTRSSSCRTRTTTPAPS